MKTFILNKLDKVKKYAQTDLQKDKLTQSPWILFDPDAGVKTTYFFKEDGRLIISIGGKVELGKWELLSSVDLLISHSDNHYLLNHSLQLDNILLLNSEGQEGYVAFLNEKATTKLITNIQQLEDYINIRYSITEHNSDNTSKDYSDIEILNNAEFIEKIDLSDLVWGNYSALKYSLGETKFNVFFGRKSQKYFYQEIKTNTKIYVDNLNEGIIQSFRYKIYWLNR